MCLSIPVEILKLEGQTATVQIGGTLINADTSLLDDVNVGDYVLVHTGIALSKISEEEAIATLQLFKEYSEFNAEMDNLEQGGIENTENQLEDEQP